MDNTQTRRLQQSGGSTYIVSLPKDWMEELQVKAGDQMAIIKNPNRSLTIFSENSKAKTDAVINTGQKDTAESLKRKIIATYLRGYKTIQVRTRGEIISPNHAKAVKNMVRSSMIGTEIVESSSANITIQVLTRLPELSFRTALQRMYLIAANMHNEAMEALANTDIQHAQEIVSMDDEVDRFGLYMRRNLVIAIEDAQVLQEMGLANATECLGYRAAIGRIERIADHAVLIAKRIKFIDQKIDSTILKNIVSTSQQAVKIFGNSITALDDKNYENAECVIQDVSLVIEKEKSIMSKIKDSTKNSGVIRFILEDIRRVIEYSNDIAEIVIDENIDVILEKKD